MANNRIICRYISQLPAQKLTSIAETLDVIQPEEHNWRQLVKLLQKYQYEYHEHKIEDFAKEIARVDGSPSSALLYDMIERQVPLSIFRDILKQMKHIPALEALGVREKPSITHEPMNLHKKYEGEHLKIDFRAYAIPRPRYQWYKRYGQDWRVFNDSQSRPELIFDKLTLEDMGEYKCQALNEKGEAYTCNVAIHVMLVKGISGSSTKPRIPSEVTVYEHESLRIEAKIDSLSSANAWSCIWYRNPKQVTQYGHDRAHYLPDQTTLCLHIPQVSIDSSGLYYCCIFSNFNQDEKYYSDPCLVTVIPFDYTRPLPNSPPFGPDSNEPSYSDGYYPPYRRRTTTDCSNPPSYPDEYTNSHDYYQHHYQPGDSDFEYNTIGSRTSSNTSTKPQGKHRPISPLELEEEHRDRPVEGIIKETPIDEIVHLKHFQAEPDDAATYQWYFIPFNQADKPPILKEKWTAREQIFKLITKDFYGSYYCEQTLSDLTKRYSLWTKVCPPAINKCRDKVALLIGNQKYREQVFTLHLPESDTRDLAGRLRSLGFRVVTLVNLNSKDMRIAIKNYVKLLNTGVYALFYYGGHGFEKDGENYLMGVESSREYKIEHCIEAKWIREQMAFRNAKLNMMILDMCRTKVVTTANSPPQPAGWRDNPELENAPHIIAYSCSPSCQAFERPADENSIYMAQLLRCIGEPIRVESLLLEVSKRVSEVGKESDVPDFKWMHPFFKTNLNEVFSLHDPIDSDNPYKEDYDLIAQRWQEVYQCPPKQIIQSDDGDIGLRLHFDAEHSNVLLIGVENMVGSLNKTELVSLKLQVYHNWPSAVESYSVTCEDLDELICPGALIPQVRNLLARYRIPDLQLFKYGMKLVFTVVYQFEGNTVEKRITYIPDPPPLYAKLIFGQDTY